MSYEKVHHEADIDFKVTGEPPIPSLLGPDALMLPTGVRLHYFHGQLSQLWVFGLKMGSNGRVLKTVHTRSYTFDQPGERDDISHPDSPAWLRQLIAESGVVL